MVERSKVVAKAADLTEAERGELNRWLLFGMDRGLLAEYRAWAATFKIYQEGLAIGLWTRRPWLDKILSQKRSEEKYSEFSFRFLDARSADPTELIFSNRLIADGLKTLRQTLRDAPAPPPLYALAPILSAISP